MTSASGSDPACIFCAAPERDLARDDLILLRGRCSHVILNLYPYNSGHLMVVPDRHLPNLAAMTQEEQAELMRFTRLAEMALTEAYSPQGINVGINLGRSAGAGVIDHLHVHLVPRWSGDTNFMTVIGDVRVLPEDLATTAKKLRPIFERLSREEATEAQRCSATETRRHRDNFLSVPLCLCGNTSASLRLGGDTLKTMHLELTPDQASFNASVEQFARDVVAPRAAAIDDTGDYPLDVMRAAAGQGLFGVAVPKAWGGAGRDYVSYALAIETISKASATVGVALSVTNSLVAELIAHAGRASQKEQWLRKLTSGEAIGAFALSEPDAGTDAANQRTRAVKSGDRYRLTGRKVWVANADAASLAIVFACTRPGLRGQGVTAFLVPMDTPGITRTARADSLGVRGLGCMDLEFDVEVGDEQALGPIDQGFRLAMWALQGGRVAIAAQALGIGEAAIAEAIAHAKQREQFGQPIANYQSVQFMLSDMATELDAARLLTWKAAAAKDQQADIAIESSMAKLAASEAAHRAADKAMQILASAGYRRGSMVERLFRDVRATEIYQGTSEAQRMIIAGQILAG